MGAIEPILIQDEAIAVLNQTDPRWPALWETLQAEHDLETILDLHIFMSENRLAAQQLANRYYPLALVLGLGVSRQFTHSKWWR